MGVTIIVSLLVSSTSSSILLSATSPTTIDSTFTMKFSSIVFLPLLAGAVSAAAIPAPAALAEVASSPQDGTIQGA
ncbi:hypothetical protein GGP41_007031 [Bipolaris sorokiniana]|uniref:REJ domain-containing protein n=1 Tax=Cochliobolus sativus TaxID=45130 RepID=A0A8H5ZSA4_COCSA|nr:hypothetical protein GGP41_007031 [Bipolaris sorokiniana]